MAGNKFDDGAGKTEGRKLREVPEAMGFVATGKFETAGLATILGTIAKCFLMALRKHE